MECHQEVLVSYLPSGKVSELFALQTAMFTSITADILSSATCEFCCRCFVAPLEHFSLSFVAYKLDFNGAVKTFFVVVAVYLSTGSHALRFRGSELLCMLGC